MLRRLLLPALLATLLVAGSAASAPADFTPAATPGGARIFEFAAAGDTWVATTIEQGAMRAWRSADAGASWTPVDTGAGDADELRVAAGPDGAFYLAVRANGAVRLLRLAAGDATPSEVRIGLTPRSDPHLATPSWDAQGRMWLALIDSDADGASSQLTVARVDGGVVAEQHTLAGVPTPAAGWAIDASTGSVVVDLEFAAYALRGDTLAALGDGVGRPLFADGGLTFMSGGQVSPDGGQTLAGDGGSSILPVHGDPKLLITGNDVVARWSPALFTATGLVAAGNVRSAWATRGGLALQVVPDQPGGASLLFSPTIPRPGSVLGTPSASSQTMVGRLNAVRRASGLPPVADDALIATAAAAHSRYWAHRAAPSNILGLHEESPGTPGFTGVEPWDRCRAAGTACSAEVMYPGMTERRAVDGWAPTLFHGALITDPLAWRAGGAVAGHGPAVMDLGGDAGLVTGPVPFPTGRYGGALGYFGEAPDPGAACAKAHGPRIRAPYGPTMFLRLPGGLHASAFAVKRAGRGRALRGCLINGAFVLDDPVRPKTTYTVQARWALPGAAAQTVRWTFRTGR